MLNGSLIEEAYCSECRGEPDDKPAVTHGEPQAPDQAITENPTRLPICRLLRLIAFLMALIRVLWFDLRWKTEEVDTKKSELEDKMTFLPAAWMVFTNTIMISMWSFFTSLRRSFLRQPNDGLLPRTATTDTAVPVGETTISSKPLLSPLRSCQRFSSTVPYGMIVSTTTCISELHVYSISCISELQVYSISLTCQSLSGILNV